MEYASRLYCLRTFGQVFLVFFLRVLVFFSVLVLALFVLEFVLFPLFILGQFVVC